MHPKLKTFILNFLTAGLTGPFVIGIVDLSDHRPITLWRMILSFLIFGIFSGLMRTFVFPSTAHKWTKQKQA